MRLHECSRLAVLALFLLAAPARADYLSDQIDACAAALTPANRAAIIDACSHVLQMGELPATIQSPAFVARGNAYAFAANFPKALADFSVAIDIDAKNPAPLSARGVALMKQRKFQDAETNFTAALKLDAGNAMALYGHGLSTRKLGRDGEAEMAKAASLDPGIAQFYTDNGLSP